MLLGAVVTVGMPGMLGMPGKLGMVAAGFSIFGGGSLRNVPTVSRQTSSGASAAREAELFSRASSLTLGRPCNVLRGGEAAVPYVNTGRACREGGARRPPDRAQEVSCSIL